MSNSGKSKFLSVLGLDNWLPDVDRVVEFYETKMGYNKYDIGPQPLNYYLGQTTLDLEINNELCVIQWNGVKDTSFPGIGNGPISFPIPGSSLGVGKFSAGLSFTVGDELQLYVNADQEIETKGNLFRDTLRVAVNLHRKRGGAIKGGVGPKDLPNVPLPDAVPTGFSADIISQYTTKSVFYQVFSWQTGWCCKK